MCRILHYCRCTTPETFDDRIIRPVKASPADFLGFQRKCCGCIKLRTAAILICIISFAWGAYELQTADKFISKLFPSEKVKQVKNGVKIGYIICVVVFVIATGVLLLGIMMHNYKLVHIYVWCGFIFVCISVVLTTVIVLTEIITGSDSKKLSMTIVFAVIWHSLFFYFLTVVNSYKMTLW